MKVLNYKTFRTNGDFVNWQKTFEKEPHITQLTPWVSGIDMSGHEDSSMNGHTTCGIFITYITEE